MSAENPPPPAGAIPLSKRLTQVAWMSILVGLGLELALLGCAAAFGKGTQGNDFVAGVVQKVSWSFFVCSGIALGTASAKLRPATAGMAGLLSAPAAFFIARTIHKSVAQALSASVAAGPNPILLAVIKAVQYGVFGAIIGYLGGQTPLRAGRYAAVGALAGIVFGGLIVWLSAASAQDIGNPLSAVALTSRVINEILFPIGCALVLFAVDNLGKSAAPKAAA